MVDDVGNGPIVGGTGNFIVRSWKSATIIDENENFPAIGFAKAPGVFTSVALSIEGSLFTSYSPMHKFTMTFAQYLPQDTWIRVTFPAEYTFRSEADGGLR